MNSYPFLLIHNIEAQGLLFEFEFKKQISASVKLENKSVKINFMIFFPTLQKYLTSKNMCSISIFNGQF